MAQQVEQELLHEKPWPKVAIGQGEKYRCDMCGVFQEEGAIIHICPLMEGKGYSLMQFCGGCYKDSLKEEEKAKYLRLNNLHEAECTTQDLENIEFNIKYRLEHGEQ